MARMAAAAAVAGQRRFFKVIVDWHFEMSALYRVRTEDCFVKIVMIRTNSFRVENGERRPQFVARSFFLISAKTLLMEVGSKRILSSRRNGACL